MSVHELQQLIDYLMVTIGLEATANTVGVRPPSVVESWGHNDSWPDEDQIERLELARDLLQRALQMRTSQEVQTWFVDHVMVKVSCDNFTQANAALDQLLNTAA